MNYSTIQLKTGTIRMNLDILKNNSTKLTSLLKNMDKIKFKDVSVESFNNLISLTNNPALCLTFPQLEELLRTAEILDFYYIHQRLKFILEKLKRFSKTYINSTLKEVYDEDAILHMMNYSSSFLNREQKQFAIDQFSKLICSHIRPCALHDRDIAIAYFYYLRKHRVMFANHVTPYEWLRLFEIFFPLAHLDECIGKREKYFTTEEKVFACEYYLIYNDDLYRALLEMPHHYSLEFTPMRNEGMETNWKDIANSSFTDHEENEQTELMDDTNAAGNLFTYSSKAHQFSLDDDNQTIFHLDDDNHTMFNVDDNQTFFHHDDSQTYFHHDDSQTFFHLDDTPQSIDYHFDGLLEGNHNMQIRPHKKKHPPLHLLTFNPNSVMAKSNFLNPLRNFKNKSGNNASSNIHLDDEKDVYSICLIEHGNNQKNLRDYFILLFDNHLVVYNRDYWNCYDQLTIVRRYASLISIENKIYVIGGINPVRCQLETYPTKAIHCLELSFEKKEPMKVKEIICSSMHCRRTSCYSLLFKNERELDVKCQRCKRNRRRYRIIVIGGKGNRFKYEEKIEEITISCTYCHRLQSRILTILPIQLQDVEVFANRIDNDHFLVHSIEHFYVYSLITNNWIYMDLVKTDYSFINFHLFIPRLNSFNFIGSYSPIGMSGRSVMEGNVNLEEKEIDITHVAQHHHMLEELNGKYLFIRNSDDIFYLLMRDDENRIKFLKTDGRLMVNSLKLPLILWKMSAQMKIPLKEFFFSSIVI
ncbi:hypothetical protein SNEBB_005984 [Seison nebaliae]|nr:hypothetical protein SNEBB_005984 [Seison nebaliae]